MPLPPPRVLVTFYDEHLKHTSFISPWPHVDPHSTLVNDIHFAICSFSSGCSVPVHPGADPAAQVACPGRPDVGLAGGFPLHLK